MSTLRVSAVNNAAASVGGLAIDSSGNVTGGLPSPNRNLLYNGAMQVSQRGTSASAITAQYNTADRWAIQKSNAGTWTQDIQVDAPTGSGFRNSLRFLCTTGLGSLAAGDTLLVEQILEGQDVQRIRKGTSSAQRLTLSFWVKSNVTGTYVARVVDADNSRHVAATYSVSASATWEKKTITFPADTTGAFDNDNAASLRVQFWLAAGSNFTSGTLATTWASIVTANNAVGQVNAAAATNNYWQVTGVQLETGDVATDFEFKSYGQELRECQRYYYRHVSNNGTGWACHYYSATQVNAIVHYPVTMRTAPSLKAASGTNYYTIERNGGEDQVNEWALTTNSTNSARIYNNTQASGTAGHGGWFYLTNSDAYIDFDAEL